MNQRAFRLLLAYDGTDYAGWQVQPGRPTIQGRLEQAVERITGEASRVHGAGRTDAGVHALGMCAHFHTASAIPAKSLARALNAVLPRDIRVLEAAEVSLDFHSRFHARGKTYRYHLTTAAVQMPHQRRYQAHLPGPPLDLEQVRACLEVLLGEHDFGSFEGSGSRDRDQERGRGARRTLVRAWCRRAGAEEGLERGDPHQVILSFTGDGFLRHMVRNLAGTLVLAGRGRLDPADMEAILAARDRSAAGPTAPARGLFLHEVFYTQAALERLD